MTLISDWRYVLRKAWSMRMMALSGLFSAVEVLLPIFSSYFPRGVFAVLSLACIPIGMWLRCVKQRDAE